MNILAVGGLAILSAVLYRMGGSDKFNTKARDVGCSAVTTLAIYLLHPHFYWWAYLIHFGLLWGSLTTYWDFLNHDKEVFWTWIITGMFYGVAACSFLFFGISVLHFLARVIFLGIFTMAWREIEWPWRYSVNEAVWDEAGVGFLLTMSVVML